MTSMVSRPKCIGFLLVGHLKHLVYGTTFESSEELRARIIECCDTIQHTHGIFERVRQSMRRRSAFSSFAESSVRFLRDVSSSVCAVASSLSIVPR